jgi:hypothetical protein
MTVAALAAPASASATDPSIEDGSAQAALDQARERWSARGLDDYDFRVRRSCFCSPEYPRARRVRVRDGRPVAPHRSVRDYATVPRLFRVVQEAIDEKAAILEVDYRPSGLPRRIYVDYSFMIADEEQGLRADRLRPR